MIRPRHNDPTEETKPRRSFSEDTQPSLTYQQMYRAQWLLAVVILLSIGSLTLTLGWYLSLQEGGAGLPVSRIVTPTSARLQLQLDVAGAGRQVETRAQTVGQLLREQNIRLGRDDAISDALDSPLRADMTITIARARDVVLTVNGEQRQLRTPYDNPYDMLAQQGIAAHPQDDIRVNGVGVPASQLLLWSEPVTQIDIRQAVRVTIDDDGQTQTLQTSAATVGDALFEAGITLYLTDQVTPGLDTPLTHDTRVTIQRATPLFIEIDGITLETRVQGTTVGDALAEAGIALVGLDYSLPPEDQTIEAGITVTVLRVSEEIVSHTEEIPYETLTQADPETPLDQTRVLQGGQVGVRRYDTRVRYADGEEIGREPAGSEVVQQPQNRIIGYGTQIVLRTIDTPDGPKQYWRKIRAYATSYHPEALGGDSTTAIGMTLEKGIIAGDPEIIPYRTNLYVPGYGTGVMADTGGPRSSPYWVDLGYSDADWESWSGYVDVYLLTPVPENIDYRLPTFTRLRGR